MNNNMVGCISVGAHMKVIYIRQTKPSWLESCDGVGGGGCNGTGSAY